MDYSFDYRFFFFLIKDKDSFWMTLYKNKYCSIVSLPENFVILPDCQQNDILLKLQDNFEITKN